MNYRILDLFCGAGGFSAGLEQLREFKTLIGLDFDKQALNTFKNNHKNAICICGDITQQDIKKEVIQHAKNLKINMIIGGPPCQGFSNKGKNLGLKDPRNFLFLEYIEIVKSLKPEIFIIENVKNLISCAKGYFLEEIKAQFNALGYQLSYKILNAKDYGVPQSRERAFIVGALNFSFDFNHLEICKSVDIKEAISDLAYLNSNEGAFESAYLNPVESSYQALMRENSKKLYNHQATNHSKVALEKLKLIPSEQGKNYLPKNLHGKQQFKSTWGRLAWSKLSPTIDTRFDTPSNGTNSHPELHRSITPREAARIQSFKDNYIFYGNKTSICKQIGNAVPPLLALALGKALLKSIK
ncbi:DNA cytosine methyltransferase [Helicobacter cetorum]|uniref:DNA cytosine methyltransferase n=1 Tax=Helicobacter cetorum TaxID=138563 RepID=UPI000CF0FAB4|nr:DNA cytosine methyltransferase [Helicobacter cetorum]